MTEDELRQIDEKTELVKFQLDGKISMIQMDADGNELLSQEMDGDMLMKILLDVFTTASQDLTPEILDLIQTDEE